MTMSFEKADDNMSDEELVERYGATREELEGSGELTPEGPREGSTNGGPKGPGLGEGGETSPSSLVTAGKPPGEVGPSPGAMQPGETQGEAITRYLLGGKTREELVAMDFNPNTVRTIYSQLKTAGRIKEEKKPPPGSARKKDASELSSMAGMQVFAKGSPPEAIISSIKIPDVSDGQGVSFEQGMKFGMSVVILGVRVAQELSGIGITQAKPILDMAKSMREGEAMAAKNAAGEAAMEAAGMVRDSMMPMLTNIQRGGGEGGDPMKAMMVRTMEPIMSKLMGGMLGRLTGGKQPLQITDGKGTAGGVDGWTRRSE